MILGTLAEEHGLYGGIDTTVKPDGRDLKDALAEAIQHLPQGFYNNPETPPEQERETEVDYNVKPFCYKAERGKLYQRVGDEMVEQAIPKTPKDAYQRICGMIALREEPAPYPRYSNRRLFGRGAQKRTAKAQQQV